MQILNMIGPSFDPFCTLVSVLKLEFMPLITMLWAQAFNSPHCLLMKPIQLLFYEYLIRNNIESHYEA